MTLSFKNPNYLFIMPYAEGEERGLEIVFASSNSNYNNLSKNTFKQAMIYGFVSVWKQIDQPSIERKPN